MKIFLFIILLCCVMINSKAVENESKSDFLNLKSFYSEVNNNPQLKYLFKNQQKVKPTNSDNELCTKQFEWFVSELNKTQMWSLNMFDSWGKIPSGIFYGNSYDLGNFDQCLEVNYETNINELGDIRGQYCLSIISLDLSGLLLTDTTLHNKSVKLEERLMPSIKTGSISLAIGLCFPATCSPKFVKENLDYLFSLYNLSVIDYDPDEKCYKNEEIKFEIIDYLAIVFFSIIVILMISSTIYDLITRHYNKTIIPALLTFSVYTNGQKLFSCKKSISQDVMHCLNGIRGLSIIWVVFGHAYLMKISGTLINAANLPQYVENVHSLLLLSAPIAVDTFFLLSGLLITKSIFNELTKTEGKLNIPLMYFHRYLRLTPSFAALIFFCESLMRYCTNGPLWKSLYNGTITQCDKHWWSALLYVQNYVNPNELCLGHSWYLSVDTQLFLLSPLILYPLWKWGKKFIGMIVVLVLLSMGCVFTTFYLNKFTLSVINTGALQSLDKNRLLYYPTHARMGAWLIGVSLGFIFHSQRDKRITFTKIWFSIGWIISLGTILAIIFGPYNIQQKSYVENVVESALYESFSRVSWSIALSWIIFACVKGHGGPINWFLSLPVWQPFARLSYSIYLLHLVIQTILLGSTKSSEYFSDLSSIHKFWGDIGLTISVSVLWTLAFESPITVLEKFLIKRN